jgi:hypothetical protein
MTWGQPHTEADPFPGYFFQRSPAVQVSGLSPDILSVATGERGYQIHRRHRYPGTHPVARGRFFALTVPRRHAHELKFAVRTEQGRA